ncbi:hypothetical protein [Paenibacillus chitinolyticus]
MKENSSIREVTRLSDAIFHEEYGINPQMDLDNILKTKEYESKELIHQHVDDQMVLYDRGLQAIINVHEILEDLHQTTHQHFTFLVLSGKICTTLIAIRKMLETGLLDAAKCLNRSLIESIDLFYTSLINPDFNANYGNTKELYDNNEFWYENINRGKLKKEIKKLFETLGSAPELIEHFNQRRKDQQDFLSNSIHSSFNSTMSNYVMMKIDFSGFSSDIFGKVTTGYPNILNKLLDEMYLYLQIFGSSIINKLPSLGLSDISQYPVFLYNAQTFEGFYTEYFDVFEKQVEDIMEIFEELQKHFSNNP